MTTPCSCSHPGYDHGIARDAFPDVAREAAVPTTAVRTPWRTSIRQPFPQSRFLHLRRRTHRIDFVLLRQLAMNVGPEFLHHDRDGVIPDLRTQNIGGIT